VLAGAPTVAGVIMLGSSNHAKYWMDRTSRIGQAPVRVMVTESGSARFEEENPLSWRKE